MGLREAAIFRGATAGIKNSLSNLRKISEARVKTTRENDLFDLEKKERTLRIEKLEKTGQLDPLTKGILESINTEKNKQRKTIVQGQEALQNQAQNQEMTKIDKFENVAVGAVKSSGRENVTQGAISNINPNLPRQTGILGMQSQLEDQGFNLTFKDGLPVVRPQTIQQRKALKEFKSVDVKEQAIDSFFEGEDNISGLIKAGISPNEIDKMMLQRRPGAGQTAAQTVDSEDAKTEQQAFNEFDVQEQGERQPGQGVVEKLDELGRPEGSFIPEAIEQREIAKEKGKQSAALETTKPVIKSILQDFEDANAEIEARIPKAFESGLGGFIARQELKIGSSKFFDEFPAVATLADNLKADATTFAKAAGEVRPTDMDIKRFLEILLDPRERSLATNLQKMRSMKRRMGNKKIAGKRVNTEWMQPFIDQQERRLKRLGETIDIDGFEVTITERTE